MSKWFYTNTRETHLSHTRDECTIGRFITSKKKTHKTLIRADIATNIKYISENTEYRLTLSRTTLHVCDSAVRLYLEKQVSHPTNPKQHRAAIISKYASGHPTRRLSLQSGCNTTVDSRQGHSALDELSDKEIC